MLLIQNGTLVTMEDDMPIVRDLFIEDGKIKAINGSGNPIYSV